MNPSDPTYHGFSAPVPNRRRLSGGISRRTLLLIGGGVVALIAAIFLLVAGQDKTGPLQARLSARLVTLQKIVAEGQKNAKDPDLRRVNTDISIHVLSNTTSINAELKKLGLGKVDSSITDAEADQASFATLKEAALNNRFDDAYRKLIAQKLDSTNALIKELYDKSKSKSLRTTLSTAYTSFKQLQSELAETNS